MTANAIQHPRPQTRSAEGRRNLIYLALFAMTGAQLHRSGEPVGRRRRRIPRIRTVAVRPWLAAVGASLALYHLPGASRRVDRQNRLPARRPYRRRLLVALHTRDLGGGRAGRVLCRPGRPGRRRGGDFSRRHTRHPRLGAAAGIRLRGILPLARPMVRRGLRCDVGGLGGVEFRLAWRLRVHRLARFHLARTLDGVRPRSAAGVLARRQGTRGHPRGARHGIGLADRSGRCAEVASQPGPVGACPGAGQPGVRELHAAELASQLPAKPAPHRDLQLRGLHRHHLRHRGDRRAYPGTGQRPAPDAGRPAARRPEMGGDRLLYPDHAGRGDPVHRVHLAAGGRPDHQRHVPGQQRRPEHRAVQRSGPPAAGRRQRGRPVHAGQQPDRGDGTDRDRLLCRRHR